MIFPYKGIDVTIIYRKEGKYIQGQEITCPKMYWINPTTITHPKLCWQRKCTIHKANIGLYFMPKTFCNNVLVDWSISSNTLTGCMGGYILNQYRQSFFLHEITCLLGCIVGIMRFDFSPWNQFLNGLLEEIMAMILPRENISRTRKHTVINAQDQNLWMNFFEQEKPWTWHIPALIWTQNALWNNFPK